MSLLGKILAFVNIFAVLGVLALLSMNFIKRQNWEYAVFREDLMIDGLPLDGTEKDALQQVVAEKIGKDTQQDLFKQTSPNTPVTTQEAEVQRVKQQLDSQVQAAGDKKIQIAAYARILTPMAETIEQRTRLIAYQTYLQKDEMFGVLKARLQAAHKAATAPPPPEGKAPSYEVRFRESLALTFSDPPGPFGEEFLTVMKAAPNTDFDKALEQSLDNQLTQLQGQYDQMFKNVSQSTGTGQAAAATRKRAIARLLFNMTEILLPPGDANLDLASNPAYKRFFIVVGVKAALEAINDQANVLQGLAFESASERLRERYIFADEHRKEVDLVLEKKVEVDEQKTILAQKKKEAEDHVTSLAKRRLDVKFYEDQLAVERRKTAKHLEEMRQVSDQLLAERVKLRNKFEDNQKLEKQIRTLEQGR